uniref:Nucleotide-diphospho-sugar transferase domain-containing protein n=2 Tax=Plectus sambesii TaxID=2011161 RepID=A0A914UNM5_9BILA
MRCKLVPICIIGGCMTFFGFLNIIRGLGTPLEKRTEERNRLVLYDSDVDVKESYVKSHKQHKLTPEKLQYYTPAPVPRRAHDGDDLSALLKDNVTIEVNGEFLQNFSATAHTVYARYTDFVLFTMVNKAYLTMTYNWLCNVEPFDGIIERLLVVSMDNETCTEISARSPAVTCMWLDLSTNAYDDALNWGKQSYVNFLTIRAQLMLSLAEANVSYVLFETDAIWFRDPIGYWRNATLIDDADIVVPIKGYPDQSLTLSFNPMIVLPTDTTRLFMRHFTQTLLADASLFDQDVMDPLCKRMYMGVRCRTFPWEDISDGLWFKLSESERKTFRPYVVNNNYYVGVDNKITRQALNGLWFLDLKGNCDGQRVRNTLAKHQR